MNQYVPSVEQLVTEIVVGDCKRSADFYRRLGFNLLREAGDFVELTWENHRFYLAEPSAFHDAQVTISLSPPAFPVANLRVMVPNVDDYWALSRLPVPRYMLSDD
jgi:catechol 2,3-dioxygenase-like lactoylglutathione lyase family enzyme